tara:strand:+ start:4608 stop:5375 length:768 start_codon:yes stop_codon:yes gene_type:complete
MHNNISKNSIVNPKKGLLLPHLKLKGPQQMALDQILLKKSIASSDFSIAARFYTWKGNWLSIGKNQINIPSKWKDLLNQKKINIVRRPSGGKAVLHSGGLTYALIWKNPPKRKHEAYFAASQWLLNGFSDLGLPLTFGNQNLDDFTENCFSRSTAADLIDFDGNKRIGSAQLWQKGHLLQHGEILLEPPQELWLKLFSAPAPKPISIKFTSLELEKVLTKYLLNYWSKTKWEKCNLNENDMDSIKSNSNKFEYNI